MAVSTKQRVQSLFEERFPDRQLIIVSNREPYIHERTPEGICCRAAVSGMTTALDPLLRASGGTWVAHGSGSGDWDVVDTHGRVCVPPEAASYVLRRVWLPKQLEEEYYNGLSNECLWPLCHVAFHSPRFSARHWDSYRKANELFADAILDEAGGRPALVFIQDYHLALLSKMLKDRNPNLTVAQFWHIPWPNRERFRVFPWKDELLSGLLGNDLLGFHLLHDCENFLEAAQCCVAARVDRKRASVSRDGSDTAVRAFPIGVDFEERTCLAANLDLGSASAEWISQIGRRPEILGIGIDRIDYTKGIPERLAAIDRLLESHPEYIGRLVFLQVGVPSRMAIAAYQELSGALMRQVDEINRKWSAGSWKPLIFVRRDMPQRALVALHLMADFCLITSLHDGMNLVAKEFVASRLDGDGVLILSEFAGAARELSEALIVNPFAIDEVAEAMHRAISMPAEERNRRMNRMRSTVAANNVYRWAEDILLTLVDMRNAGPDFPASEPKWAFAEVGS